MAIYAGCDIPEELYYHPAHDLWVRLDSEDTATLGMSDIAQTAAGKLLYVRFKGVGKRVKPGQSAATIESAKWVGPFVVPFAAEIMAVNTAYEQTLTLANTDPYGEGWLVKVRLLDPQAARAELITGAAAVAHFQQRIRDNQIRCYRCEDA
ncbi:glycine cleavage system protein H [Chloroflexales bacterium ZM16-3]|nr:glycine cleavage system protein H [Chloroflexales bacterium ZM16-3]